jgi:hypothetical protein
MIMNLFETLYFREMVWANSLRRMPLIVVFAFVLMSVAQTLVTTLVNYVAPAGGEYGVLMRVLFLTVGAAWGTVVDNIKLFVRPVYVISGKAMNIFGMFYVPAGFHLDDNGNLTYEQDSYLVQLFNIVSEANPGRGFCVFVGTLFTTLALWQCVMYLSYQRYLAAEKFRVVSEVLAALDGNDRWLETVRMRVVHEDGEVEETAFKRLVPGTTLAVRVASIVDYAKLSMRRTPGQDEANTRLASMYCTNFFKQKNDDNTEIRGLADVRDVDKRQMITLAVPLVFTPDCRDRLATVIANDARVQELQKMNRRQLADLAALN